MKSRVFVITHPSCWRKKRDDIRRRSAHSILKTTESSRLKKKLWVLITVCVAYPGDSIEGCCNCYMHFWGIYESLGRQVVDDFNDSQLKSNSWRRSPRETYKIFLNHANNTISSFLLRSERFHRRYHRRCCCRCRPRHNLWQRSLPLLKRWYHIF